MGKLFGTDGVRGIVNETLTAELATRIGEASAYVLGNGKKVNVVIGRDTRYSGDMLLFAVSAGLISRGANVIDLGVIPTPAVSYLVKETNADMGIMISASHNPSEHNGIKLFNNEGFKLPDDIENKIEHYILEEEVPVSSNLGTFITNDKYKYDYVNYLIKTIEKIDNMKVVVDASNGSASVTAPILFDKLGIDATIINKDYDGYNINKDCGSTHMNNLIEKVRELKADIGIAYDGDADRCLLVDELGNIVDGDFIMAICGKYLKDNNKLTNNTIVGTVMSNLGLKKFCEKENINFVDTKVGDKYVLENMLANNYIIGGEQSGHIIFKELSNTGDGELTSLQVLEILSKTKKKLSELKSIMISYPQVLVNVAVTKEGKKLYVSDEEINNLIKKTQDELKDNGRVLIRASGTEDLVRVMIEGTDTDIIQKQADGIAKKIKTKYGK